MSPAGSPWRHAPESLLFLLSIGLFLLAFVPKLLQDLRSSEGGEAEHDRRLLRTLFVGGLGVRLIVAALLRQTGYNYFIAPDEVTFHVNGSVFQLWVAGYLPEPISGQHAGYWQVGYFYLVGSIYTVTGPDPIYPILLNSVVGAATGWPAYVVARDLCSRRAGRIAAVFTTFFPSLLLWSTLLIRDTVVVMVLILLVVTEMRLSRGITLGRVLAFVALILALGSLRQYLFLMVAISAAVGLLVGRSKRTGRALLGGLASIVLLVMLMKATGLGSMEMENASLAALNQQRQYNTLGVGATGSLRPEVDISTPTRALAWLPIGIIYFLFSPFPWQVLSLRQAVALPDVLIFYYLVPSIVRGLVWLVRSRLREATMLILLTITITVLYALVEGNVGIVFRHRAQILIPMLIFAAVGIATREEARKKKGAEA